MHIFIVFRHCFKGDTKGHDPSSCAYGSQKELARQKNKNLERWFFDFKEKNETRRKEINASQFAIRDFNDSPEKHMSILCFLMFKRFLLRAKTFQAHISRKETIFPVYEKHVFTCTIINVNNIDEWFVTCYRAPNKRSTVPRTTTVFRWWVCNLII